MKEIIKENKKENKKKTTIFLERNIRHQILLGSDTFEPQIKGILRKLESISEMRLRFSKDFTKDFPAVFECPFCEKKFEKASFSIYHLIFLHRTARFEFKIEQSALNPATFTLMISGKNKPKGNFAKKNSAFFYRNKPNKKLKMMRYDVKLLVQNTLKKGFCEEIDWRKKPKNHNSLMFLSDSEEENVKNVDFSLSRDEIKRKLEGKIFYHSGNIMETIENESLFEESELEIDDKPIRESEEKAINDFEDIDETDKEFFKLWNNFVRDFEKPKKKIEDFRNLRLVAFCKRDYKAFLSEFVGKNKAILTKLRYNFVMHLVTFQIYGLINGNDILQLLLELDDKSA